MLRKTFGLVIGLLSGLFVIGTLEALGHFLYPTPKELNFEDKVFLANYINQLPIPALLVTIIAHGVGSFVGSYTANVLAKSIGVVGLIASLLFLALTVSNLILVPYHPIWFVVTDILVTFIGGWAAFKLTLKRIK